MLIKYVKYWINNQQDWKMYLELIKELNINIKL